MTDLTVNLRGNIPIPDKKVETRFKLREVSKYHADIMAGLKYSYMAYDIESYPNYFCIAFEDVRRPEKRRLFEISERVNDHKKIVKLIKYLKKNDYYMVGFNNLGFDYPVIHHLLTELDYNYTASEIAHELWLKTKDMIENSNFGGGFDDRIIYGRNQEVPQLDLYKIHHFDNSNRSVSLKMLEFNMRAESVQDLPYKPNTELTDTAMTETGIYCQHDTAETAEFFRRSLSKITFREKLGVEYGIDMMCHSDKKIGTQYFTNRMDEHAGEKNSLFYFEDGQRHPLQTHRRTIAIDDCILPTIEFESNEFKSVLNWLRSQEVAQTKGVFTGVPYLSILNGACMRTGRQAGTLPEGVSMAHFIDQDEVQKAMKRHKNDLEKVKIEKCHVIFNKIPFDFGTGGLHACAPAGYFAADKVNEESLAKWKAVEHYETQGLGLEIDTEGFDEEFYAQYEAYLTGTIDAEACETFEAEYAELWLELSELFLMEDVDVGSFYPSLIIRYLLRPEHIAESFTEVYSEIRQQRFSYTKAQPENLMLKLALNAAYGDTNSVFSPFYDPKVTMSVTVNGQLMLAMLSERVSLHVDRLQMIQANTDGITVKYPVTEKVNFLKICKQWERDTRMDLEYVNYSRMWVRDVNNYVAEYTNGKLKTVGAAFKHHDIDNPSTDWAKNFSTPVIKKAIVEYLTNGKPYREYIRECTDPFEFMSKVKIARTHRLFGLMDYIERPEFQDLPVWVKKMELQKRWQMQGDTVRKVVQHFADRIGDPLEYKAAKRGKEGAALMKDLAAEIPIHDSLYVNCLRWHLETGKLELPRTTQRVGGEDMQSMNRYYMAKDGYYLVKGMEPMPNNPNKAQRFTAVEKGMKLRLCNHVEEFDFSKLDYDWYFEQVEKVTSLVAKKGRRRR